MTYYKSREAALDNAVLETHTICMACGKEADGPIVGYDLTLPGSDLLTTAFFHRDCASAMAQRIICDAWPNRRDK